MPQLARSGSPPPPIESRREGGWGEGAVGPHGERAHSHSTGRARRAAHSGEGDQDRDRSRARLPGGGKHPSPRQSADGPNAPPCVGREPCGGASSTPALSPAGSADVLFVR